MTSLPGSGRGRPSIVTWRRFSVPASGTLDAAATVTTPGTADSLVTSPSKNSAGRCPGYTVRGSATSIVSTPSAWKPVSTLSRRTNV